MSLVSLGLKLLESKSWMELGDECWKCLVSLISLDCDVYIKLSSLVSAAFHE
jgi:hypothetical protein